MATAHDLLLEIAEFDSTVSAGGWDAEPCCFACGCPLEDVQPHSNDCLWVRVRSHLGLPLPDGHTVYTPGFTIQQFEWGTGKPTGEPEFVPYPGEAEHGT